MTRWGNGVEARGSRHHVSGDKRYLPPRATYWIVAVKAYMNAIQTKPGPDAAYAFRLGIVAGAIVGLAAVALLYIFGTITPVVAGYTLLVLFPVYLVLLAIALSKWLGYDKDITSLRPVYRSKESK